MKKDMSVKAPPAEQRRMRYIAALTLALTGIFVLAKCYSIAIVICGAFAAYWLFFTVWFSVNSLGVFGAITYGAAIFALSVIFAVGLGIHRGHAEELSLNGIAMSDVRATIKGHKLSRFIPFSKAGTECILKRGSKYVEVRPGKVWRKAEVKVLAEPDGGVGNDGCDRGKTVHIAGAASRAGIKALAEKEKAVSPPKE